MSFQNMMWLRKTSENWPYCQNTLQNPILSSLILLLEQRCFLLPRLSCWRALSLSGEAQVEWLSPEEPECFQLHELVHTPLRFSLELQAACKELETLLGEV